MVRSVLVFAVLAAAVLVGVLPAQVAVAGTPKLLGPAEAMAMAKASGAPVVVSAQTNERTLVTANPDTGLLDAELSAQVARVRDGAGGWREPSARLVQGADGLWRPEAAVGDIAVSPGGEGRPLATLSDGVASASFSWPTALPTPVVDDATATYPEVYPGVDLVVRVGVESVETFLYVKTVEAGRNPAVRAWSMPVATKGVTVVAESGGAQSMRDSSGRERLRVPSARVWDSAGKGSGAVHAAAEERLAEVDQTRSARVDVSVRAGQMKAAAATSFLDDPATVYPVVIDPAVEMGQTHVLRVTDDWTKWDSAVGSQGKVGYNGWSAPYYRSRMFYQFAWPKNADGSGLAPEQVSKGEFWYVQEHSPQHACTIITDARYPGVKARLANAISSDDTWSDRTGDAWHPQASVNTYLAVGHEDYCHNSKTQKWDLTGALRQERISYSYRTTVTVGLFSDDESNAMGWRHYENDEGDSPKLKLSYQGPPKVPTSVGVVGASGSPLVTTSSWPTLTAVVSLESPYSCAAPSACLSAVFTVTPVGGGSSVTVTGSSQSSNGAASTVQAPSQLAPGTYQVAAKTCTAELSLCSAPSSPVTVVVDPTPQQPTGAWVKTAWYSSTEASPGQPLTVSVAVTDQDSDVTAFTVVVTLTRGGVVTSTTSTVTRSSGATTVLAVGSFESDDGVKVEVSAKDATSTGPSLKLATTIH